MKLFTSPFIQDGTAALVDSSAFTMDKMLESCRLLGLTSPPWSLEKCPEGYRPKMRITKFDWMSRQFEIEQNNWLIDFFGIEKDEEAIGFAPRPRFDMGILSHRAFACVTGA